MSNVFSQIEQEIKKRQRWAIGKGTKPIVGTNVEFLVPTWEALGAMSDFDSLSDKQLQAAVMLAHGFLEVEVAKNVSGSCSSFDVRQWTANPIFALAIRTAVLQLNDRQVESADAPVDYSNITQKEVRQILGTIIKTNMDLIQARSVQYAEDPVLGSGMVLVDIIETKAGVKQKYRYDRELAEQTINATKELAKLDGLYKQNETGDNVDNVPVIQIMFPKGVPELGGNSSDVHLVDPNDD